MRLKVESGDKSAGKRLVHRRSVEVIHGEVVAAR